MTDSGASLPNLPGYTTRVVTSLGWMQNANGYYPKKQTLHYMVGYKQEKGQEPILCAEERQAATDTIKAAHPPGHLGMQAASTESSLPRWIENDRKVLRFYGYFQEHVNEDPAVNMRVRKVVFLYYLEDDTMQISEPKQDNSGLPQGTLLKRHKVYITNPSTGSRVRATPECMDNGLSLSIYGTVYFITDCDAFTRAWYKDMKGTDISPSVMVPNDPLETFRTTRRRSKATLGPPSPRTDDMARFNEARLGKPSHVLSTDSLRQFLKNDGRVLRFWAMWDDRTSMYGDRRPYVVHYYLADDTMEVLEAHETNSGRDPFPVFIARAPMPRHFSQPGFTVSKRVDKRECLTPQDLRIGCAVTLHNRTMLLYACDAFTRQWYMDNLGYTGEELQDMDIREPVPTLPRPAMAPYNGYGTLLDSEQNCRLLLPKPPKKDLRKMVNKDGMILRFVCKFYPRSEIGFAVNHADESRLFVLSYFMNDDTVSVFEPPLRNSGMVGGKFLERGIKYKPGTEEQYTYKDLYVGAEIVINSFNFLLSNADEYTYSYMENNKHLFIMGDGQAVLQLLRAQVAGKEDELRTAFIEIDKDGSGHLDAEELSECLQLCGLRITKHQVIALTRMLDTDRSGTVDIKEFLAALNVTL